MGLRAYVNTSPCATPWGIEGRASLDMAADVLPLHTIAEDDIAARLLYPPLGVILPEA